MLGIHLYKKKRIEAETVRNIVKLLVNKETGLWGGKL